ncbi:MULTISPECIES: 30S ribosomal protein S8 [Cyanophyceae]|jgi:small subunit ribosomal protein S8|uniref:Small ribosomal subunit protein uS8 n=2 Tax=Thermoleptolyngbya TaxID=2303528 RepID=A0A6M8BJP2_9CYAN|nr:MULTISPECIES: 30S ribosomal protein S8 [Cyanophyceae]WOB42941.1 30S ribosomal protein S8 [Thermoleptolyngbya oregonensis NK1-22]MBF2083583.1 30S ribosomal protein S8 [Thermoleptolyngbya sp. C42_A2020_037]MDG2614737.1 30S ribosomal protein S8 [Thermoleptolyngbya sichuanensis XZ-Cy5]QKD84400.1 30S ribosomal protein S8 [Thermoleptolyngbya sichuanensis A183]BAU42178.1 30S ribosomal protein S8 [Leptolyngbya sp. O-77]
MASNDTIADMLTRIRNANLARHQTTEVPSTKMTRNIARVLLEEGFISEFSETGEGAQKRLVIALKYKGKGRRPIINALQRVSKPGLRVYSNCRDLPRVLGGIGIAIVSTSSGIMTDRDARRQGVGGEVLCYVW